MRRFYVPDGKSFEPSITVGNPGANVVELEVTPGPLAGQITASSSSMACATGYACCWYRRAKGGVVSKLRGFDEWCLPRDSY